MNYEHCPTMVQFELVVNARILEEEHRRETHENSRRADGAKLEGV